MNKKKNRKQARLYALQNLYAQSFHGPEEEVIFPEGEQAHTMDMDYAIALLQGIKEEQALLDERIQEFSPKRKIERIPTLEKSILRLAAWELLHKEELDIATNVIINEAVNLAKEFGGDSSYKMINAILDGLAKQDEK